MATASPFKPNAVGSQWNGNTAEGIDANFDDIYRWLRRLSASTGGVVGEDGSPGPPGLDGDDGEDGPMGPPGPRGATGAAGATGATGPAGPGTPLLFDGDDGADGWPIPGPMGPQGATGATGATGPAGTPGGPMGPPGADGFDGEDGFVERQLLIGSGWELAKQVTPAGAAAVEDIVGLGKYTDVLVFIRQITLSASGLRQLRVSVDNGATFLAAAGDYVAVGSAGTELNDTDIDFHATSTVAARTGMILILGFNGVGPKIAINCVDSGLMRLIPTTTPLNAVRVMNSGAGNLTGGTIYVFGR